MTEQRSFTHIEHDLLPDFREKMSHAESDEDVRKFFVRTAAELVRRATDDAVRPDHEDIGLEPDASPQWVLGDRLAGEPALGQALEGSDLPDILDRFAASAANHFRHERRHPERPRIHQR